MSSDPIEVLREALARALRAGYRSGHHDTVDGRYTDVMHGDHMEFFADEADELLADPDFAALASLSAPKPESAEAPAPWRAHGAAMDAKALSVATEISLMWGQDRSQFVSRIQVAVREAMDWTAAGGTAPPRPEASEGWHAALDSASELASNAPDARYRKRAEQVRDWIRTHPAAPQQASECGTCEPDGVYDTEGNGPMDCYACGKKAPQQPAAVDAWRAAFVAERAMRYRTGGMAIEQARIHAETDAARMAALAAGQQQGGES